MTITSAQWALHRRKETELVFEFLKRETETEKRERGHECGHQFTISVTSRGHYGLLGEDGKLERCEDADWDGALMTITVRAHDLPAALLRAASHSLGDWDMGDRDAEGEV
jgi:hypothetical protein